MVNSYFYNCELGKGRNHAGNTDQTFVVGLL